MVKKLLGAKAGEKFEKDVWTTQMDHEKKFGNRCFSNTGDFRQRPIDFDALNDKLLREERRRKFLEETDEEFDKENLVNEQKAILKELKNEPKETDASSVRNL
ncbi:MAG: hypothetical protein ACTSWW_08255 [Promethearchaeota archaeon]